MLYLAEVRKQKGGFMGKAATELKLLACQRNDQTWSAIQGDEVIPCEEASPFEQGALVMANLGGNRQLQGQLEPGGPRLVSLLQSFSKLIGEKKNQEEEIEAWNQSLTLQAQELNKREMELEADLAELEQKQEAAQGLDEKFKEVEELKAESARLQEEFDRKNAELEQAWAHLRGEQQRLEDLKGEVEPSGRLDEAQVNRIQELLSGLESGEQPIAELQASVDDAIAALNAQQGEFDTQWQAIEQHRGEAESLQREVEGQAGELSRRQQQLGDVRLALQKTREESIEQQQALKVKEGSVEQLKEQLQSQKDLQDSLSRLAVGAGDSGSEQAVDISALENMPLGELQGIVENLQQDLQKVVQFVNDQEEELTLERQDLDELQGKREQASEYERINLDQELADAQDRYQMLDQTLVGQRREVRERESILNQHLRVLRRRQGIMDTEGESQSIDFNPLLTSLEEQQKQKEEALQGLEGEIEQIRSRIEELEGILAEQTSEQERQEGEVQELEETLQQQRVSLAELQAMVNRSQECLNPLQKGLNELRTKLESLAGAIAQPQDSVNPQSQAIADLKEAIGSLQG